MRALLTRHPQRVTRVLLQRGRHDARARRDRAAGARAPVATVERVDARQLQARLGQAVHQGIAGRGGAAGAVERRAAARARVARATDPLLLALDGVQDPHNLGACLRTADACGVLALIVPRDRAAPLNATARKVAAGAAETTPVATVTNLARTLRPAQAGRSVDRRRRRAGAAAGATRSTLPGRGCWSWGPRARACASSRAHCDWLVRLPSLGPVESLNVSVAAGMLLYEALRQRGSAEMLR